MTSHQLIQISIPESRFHLYLAIQEYVSERLQGVRQGRGRGEVSRSSLILDLLEEGLLRLAESEYDRT